MTTDIKDKAAVEEKLWREISDTKFGMIAPNGGSEHFQPMTTFAEPETGKLWFYSSDETDLARAAANGCEATYVIASKDRELQASIKGRLTAIRDQLHIDKFWSSNVSAWFPQGKQDPHLTMLCLDADDAQVWISDASPLKFGFEMVKANMKGATPDVGGKTKLNL